jgi:hypothetical protein
MNPQKNRGITFQTGDLVTRELPARVWDDQIIDTIGTFRHGEFAVVVDTIPDYLRVVTGRGKVGWVLQSLIQHV